MRRSHPRKGAGMTGTTPSPSALRRKIERLEAELAALRDMQHKTHQVYAEVLARNVDQRIRVEQAVRILTGQDD